MAYQLINHKDRNWDLSCNAMYVCVCVYIHVYAFIVNCPNIFTMEYRIVGCEAQGINHEYHYHPCMLYMYMCVMYMYMYMYIHTSCVKYMYV